MSFNVQNFQKFLSPEKKGLKVINRPSFIFLLILFYRPLVLLPPPHRPLSSYRPPKSLQRPLGALNQWRPLWKPPIFVA